MSNPESSKKPRPAPAVMLLIMMSRRQHTGRFRDGDTQAAAAHVCRADPPMNRLVNE
jgi:hypothetical protein